MARLLPHGLPQGVSQVAEGEVFQPVLVARGLQQVVGQQGVASDPHQRPVQAREHPNRVLQVMAGLGQARVGEDGAQVLQELGLGNALHPDGLVLVPAQAQSLNAAGDQVLGVELQVQCQGLGDRNRRLDLSCDGGQIRRTGDHSVVLGGDLGVGGDLFCLKLLQVGSELPLHEQGAQGLHVPRVALEVFQSQGDLFGVDQDGAQDRGEPGQVCVVVNRLASLAADLQCMGDDPFQVPVLGQILRGGLLPYPRHPWDVVARVPGKALHVDDSIRAHTHALHHVIGANHAVLHDVENANVGGEQLVEVLVTGDHRDLALRPGQTGGQSADDVVGLDAFDGQVGATPGLGQGLKVGPLFAQLVGHAGPVALVLGVQVHAEAGALVEDHDHVVGGMLLLKLAQHVGKTQQGAGGETGCEHVAWHGMEHAEGVVAAVDEEELLGQGDLRDRRLNALHTLLALGDGAEPVIGPKRRPARLTDSRRVSLQSCPRVLDAGRSEAP